MMRSVWSELLLTQISTEVSLKFNREDREDREDARRSRLMPNSLI
ncbi:MAG: hypothetical protein K940chlam3_00281 [Chlamydiae bacterium]|nr:hypothetical protein [Chlamydiota bacterium]